MAEPAKPIRILQALSVSTIGGTEQMLLQLASRMDRSLFINHVSFLDSTGPVVQRFEQLGVQVHKLDGKGGLPGRIWRMVEIVRRYPYDIVHMYGFRISLIVRFAACLVQPRPFVIHGIRGFHVTEVEEISSLKTRVALAIERLGATLVDAYIANSFGAVTFLCSRGLPKEKFIVIPNGIDVSEWNGQAVRPVKGPPKIICVANFRPIKRHCDLIEALALVRQRGVRVQCLFVGDGMTRQEAETLARERGLGEAIEFLGRRAPEEVKDLLRRADIFVLQSLWEGLPGSIMEAMAAGLPVVGTDVNGINELVIDGETGFLVPPKEPAALAERIEVLVKDPYLRRRMGKAGRLRIMREFSLEKMVHNYERVYADLVKRNLQITKTNPGDLATKTQVFDRLGNAKTIKRTQQSFGYQWTVFGEMADQFQEDFLNYIYPITPEFFVGKWGLDAGCGFGRHLYYASRFGAKMVGLDFSHAIKRAREITDGLEDVQLIQGDLQMPPFRLRSFDFVYSIGVLHHLPDPERGFRSLLPLLRPGGVVFIWVYSKSRRFSNGFLEAVRALTSRFPLGLARMLSLAGALLDWWLFILPYRLGRRLFGRAIDRVVFPRIKLYARYPFQVVYADWFDRLSAPIRHYFNGEELAEWAAGAGLLNVKISPTGLYGWRMYGELPDKREK